MKEAVPWRLVHRETAKRGRTRARDEHSDARELLLGGGGSHGVRERRVWRCGCVDEQVSEGWVQMQKQKIQSGAQIDFLDEAAAPAL
jgi:hypothetical protein